MSTREQFVQTVQAMTEEDAAFYFSWLAKMMHDMEDARDNARCLALDDDYLADPDNGERISLESFAAELGVVLE